jgi:oligopeptide/dipeptide ABC transporter ATP-binding protein
MSDDSTPLPLLAVRDLKIHFPVRRGILRRRTGTVFAVDGVDFSIERGKTLGIVGESGCGKTTVARGIVRLNSPTGGSISYDGVRIDTLGEAAFRAYRRKIQMIFQDPSSSLNPRLTVESAITEVLKAHALHGDRRGRSRRVAELIEQVGLLPAHRDRYPHEFSGGQKQRVSIARALAVEPELIVCDESVSALDVSVQAQILNLLKGLQARLGLTMLFISHDLGVIRHVSDTVAVMYLGRIVEIADRRELFAHPLHPYTSALLAAAPTLHLEGDRDSGPILQGDVPSPISPPPGCSFHPRCPAATARCREESPARETVGSGAGARHDIYCHNWKLSAEGRSVPDATKGAGS